MPRVPIYQQQVEQATPQAQIPELASLSSVNTETQKRFQAIENRSEAIGKVTNLLTQRLAEHYQMKNEAKYSELDQDFKKEVTELLYNKSVRYLDDPEDVADRGPASIDYNKKSEKEVEGIFNRRLTDAENVAYDFQRSYGKIRDKYIGMTDNDYVKGLLQHSIDNHFNSTYPSVVKHESTELYNNYNTKVNSLLEQRARDAAGISDTDTLLESIYISQDISKKRDQMNGLDDATTLKNQQEVAKNVTLGAIYGVINNDYRSAQKFLDDAKDTMSPIQVKEVQSIIDGKKIEQMSQAVYQAVKDQNFRIPKIDVVGINNEKIEIPDQPDLRRIKEFIFSDKNYTPAEKERLWSYTKARLAEDEKIRMNEEHANDVQFENTALQMKADERSMSEALKLIGPFGRNNKDRAFKAEYITKLYTKNVVTNPRVYMNLWERVQTGDIGKPELDSAFLNERLSNSDYQSLSKELFKVESQGKQIEKKAAIDRLKMRALNQLGIDKDNLPEYMYEIEQEARRRNMNPQEIIAYGTQQIESDKNTGFNFLGTNWFGDQKWRSGVKARDENNLAWGTWYLDVGKEQTEWIGRSITPNGEEYDLIDLDNFANQFGGYDRIKEGTPINNAIKSLKRLKMPATKKNIDKLLENRKDGIEPYGGR